MRAPSGASLEIATLLLTLKWRGEVNRKLVKLQKRDGTGKRSGLCADCAKLAYEY